MKETPNTGLSIKSDKIECWIILDNNRIIKKMVGMDKENFEYKGKTFFLNNKYCVRRFKIVFIPITRLCLFYSQASPYPLTINPDRGDIDYHYQTPAQITERLKQGGHYVRMSMESPLDMLMQKIQFYGIIGGLILSGIILLKLMGALKI